MSSFLKALLPAFIAVSFGASAQAQWSKDVTSDDFSGEKVVQIMNVGKAISGDKSVTALVYREKDGKTDLIWRPPANHICDIDIEVQMRVDDGKVSGGMGRILSTNNKALFLNIGHYPDIVRADKLLLKVTDGCGTSAIAEFKGNALRYFPEVSEFDKLEGWITKGTGIATPSGPVQLTYSEHITGNSLYFRVSDPVLAGLDDGEPSVLISGRLFKALAFSTGSYSKLTDKVTVSIYGDDEEKAAAIEMLSQGGRVDIQVAGMSYNIDIKNFDEARKVIK